MVSRIHNYKLPQPPVILSEAKDPSNLPAHQCSCHLSRRTHPEGFRAGWNALPTARTNHLLNRINRRVIPLSSRTIVPRPRSMETIEHAGARLFPWTLVGERWSGNLE